MRTRSQTRNLNRQQQAPPAVVEPFNLEEPFDNPPLVPLADYRIMAELLQAPTEGYEDAIIIPEINANFELKHGLINLVPLRVIFELRVNYEGLSLIPLSRGSFDVIVGMDWLSKRKFVIVCHEKVVRIPLEGDEILRVHGERTQGVVKTLMNTKVGESKLSDISVVRDFIDVFPDDLSMTTQRQVEFRIYLVHGATPVAKSPYRLAPSEMQELSEQLQELQDEVLELLRNKKLYAKFTKSEKGRVKLRRVRAMSMTIQSDVKDKILGTPCETSKIKLYSKYEYEIRYHPGRANVVIDALRRKERVKPRRV
ncbi:hypothetical protein Tco_0408163 [Tanacetum coccineum]